MKRVILSLILLSASTWVFAHSPPKGFSSGALSPLPAAYLDSIWKQVQIYLHSAPYRMTPLWLTGPMSKMLQKTFEQLRDGQRVFYFTDEIREHFGIDRNSCFIRNEDRKRNCNKVRAFYLPSQDLIFIDPDLSWDPSELAQSFLHEVLHAFQYRYRYGMDASALWKLSQLDEKGSVRVKTEDLHDYLSYFYESEANWYVLSLGQNVRWNQEIQKYKKWHNLGLFGEVLTPAVLFHVAEMVFLAPVAVANGLFGLDIEWFKAHLPKDESVNNFWIEDFNALPVWPGEEGDIALRAKMFSTRELTVQKKYYRMFSFGFYPFAYKFQQKYAKRVEQTYFGELPFLFDWALQDQKNFTELHNQFYSKFLTASESDLLACEPVFEKIGNNLLGSPMEMWQTLTPADIQSCPVLSGVDLDALKSYQDLPRKSQRSPFRGRALPKQDDSIDYRKKIPGSDKGMGTEGSRPTEEVLPGFEFLPQLEVLPSH